MDSFEALYEDYPIEVSRMISRRERQEMEYKSSTLTYGEINFLPFESMFKKLYNYGFKPRGGVFLDIGCGTGRPV